MDSNKNNFESFDDQNTELPAGFGWDEMKEGVYAQMPAEKKRRRFAWWWWGASTVIGISLISWIWIYTFTSANSTQVLANQEISEAKAEQNQLSSSETTDITSTGKEQYSTSNSLPQDKTKTVNAASTSPGADGNLANAKLYTSEQLAENIQNQLPGTPPTKANRVSTTEKPTAFALADHPSFDASSTISNNEQNLPANRTESMLDGSTKVETQESLTTTSSFTDNTPDKLRLPTLATLPIKTFELSQHLLTQPEPVAVSIEPSAPLSRAEFVDAEGILTLPTSLNRSLSTPNTSAWFGYGASIGYKAQLNKRFGLSARYTFQQLTEEFAFSRRDTVLGTEIVDHTVNYVNVNTLTLISTSTVPTIQRIDRYREYFTYNTTNLHLVSVLGEFSQPIGIRGNLTLGLGGSMQHLGNVSGYRLDAQGEVVEMTLSDSPYKRYSGLMTTRMQYLHKLSPKLQLSLGINFNHALGQTAPNTLSVGAGLRWRL